MEVDLEVQRAKMKELEAEVARLENLRSAESAEHPSLVILVPDDEGDVSGDDESIPVDGPVNLTENDLECLSPTPRFITGLSELFYTCSVHWPHTPSGPSILLPTSHNFLTTGSEIAAKGPLARKYSSLFIYLPRLAPLSAIGFSSFLMPILPSS